MKIYKKLVRKLIKESIDDFFKADFVGTDSGETMLPQQAYREIRSWFENNIGIIEKLRNFSKQAKTGSIYNQADELALGMTSDVIGGLDMREIEKVRAQYISFLGDTLLKNNKKLKSILVNRKPSSKFDRGADMNNLNTLFETMFDTVDEIGIGPVNYEEFERAKNMLGHQIHDPINRMASQRLRYLNPLKDEAPPEAIPVMTGGPKRAQDKPASRSLNITNQLRSVKVTNNLALASILISYNYEADSEGLGNYNDEEITDQATEYLFQSVPSGENICILGYEDILHKDIGYGLRLLVLGTDNETFELENFIDDLRIIAEGIGQATGGVEVDYEVVETINHIKSNSMDSAIDFITKHKQGIPTNAKSASGIIKQHKDFLQYSLDCFNDSVYGGSTCKEPDLGYDNIALIFDTLENMGYEYNSII